MASAALLIGNPFNNPQPGTNTGKKFNVVGSFRVVSGIIGILHRADGTVAKSVNANVDAGLGTFTVAFDDVAIGNNYNVTVLGLNMTVNPPAAVFDTAFPVNVA